MVKDKKNKGIMFLIVIIGLIYVVNQGKIKGTGQYIGDIAETDTLLDCNDGKEYDMSLGYDCVTPCVYLSSSMLNCLNGCDLESFDANYVYYSYDSMSCNDISDGSSDVRCGFNCMYGTDYPPTECVANSWQCTTSGSYYGEHQCNSAGTGWNTPTSCAGAICVESTGRCSNICANGAITSSCDCGGTVRTSGYCCGYAYQTTPCGSGSCTDSDSGQNYPVKGTVIYGGNSYEDICVPNNGYAGDWSVKEYYCQNELKAEEIKDCKELIGMFDCADGACVECSIHPESTDPNFECVEKYGNGYVCTTGHVCQQTGHTCSYYSNNYGDCLTGTNVACSSDKTSILGGCSDLDPSNGKTWCWTTKQSCDTGNECIISGLSVICQSISGTCLDSDNGQDYIIKGTTTKGTSSFTDKCNDISLIQEYYCSNNQIQTLEYDCRNKGANWACDLYGFVGNNGKCVECTFGDWAVKGGCGGTYGTVTCASTQKPYFRNAISSPSACADNRYTIKCQPDTSCGSNTCTSCTAWSNSTGACGTRTCTPTGCTTADGYGTTKSCGGTTIECDATNKCSFISKCVSGKCEINTSIIVLLVIGIFALKFMDLK